MSCMPLAPSCGDARWQVELEDLKACSWSCKNQLQNFKCFVLVKIRVSLGRRGYKRANLCYLCTKDCSVSLRNAKTHQKFSSGLHTKLFYTENTIMMANSITPKYHVKYIRLRSMVTKSTEMTAFQFKQSTVLKFWWVSLETKMVSFWLMESPPWLSVKIGQWSFLFTIARSKWKLCCVPA